MVVECVITEEQLGSDGCDCGGGVSSYVMKVVVEEAVMVVVQVLVGQNRTLTH